MPIPLSGGYWASAGRSNMAGVKAFLKAYGITLLFTVTAVAVALHHEPWRDEIQAWMIVVDAPSIAQLVENCRYEGHPLLWYMLLYALAQCTHHIFAMQLLSVCIASVSVLLVCWYSPFTRLQQTLFVFGFYPLFQYCILSRSYGLVVLLLIGFLCLATRKPHTVFTWMVLGLLANTSATGFVLAGCGGAYLLMMEGTGVFSGIRKQAAGIAVLACCMAIAAWQMYPEPDNNFTAVFSTDRVLSVFSRLHDSYLHIAYWPHLDTWSTVHMREVFPLDTLISAVLFVLTAVLFWRNKQVGLFYIGATLSMLLLLSLTHMFSARFMGHFYLIFIASCWLLLRTDPAVFGKPLKGLLLLVLGCQLVTGCGTVYADYTGTFSNTKKVAEYIREHQLEQVPVTGAVDYTLSPISYWLQKPVYFMETHSYGRYIVWSSNRFRPLTPEGLLAQTDSLVGVHGRVVVVLTTELPVCNPLFAGLMRDSIESNRNRWVLQQKFEGALVSDENYYLYLAGPKQ